MHSESCKKVNYSLTYTSQRTVYTCCEICKKLIRMAFTTNKTCELVCYFYLLFVSAKLRFLIGQLRSHHPVISSDYYAFTRQNFDRFSERQNSPFAPRSPNKYCLVIYKDQCTCKQLRKFYYTNYLRLATKITVEHTHHEIQHKYTHKNAKKYKINNTSV